MYRMFEILFTTLKTQEKFFDFPYILPLFALNKTFTTGRNFSCFVIYYRRPLFKIKKK
jgi:hypothetical protein